MSQPRPDEASTPDAVTPLLAPHEGVPPVIDTPRALAETTERFAQGTGPVAADAERASGYRYSQRAYLVQLRRAGAGTALIDPIACPDLSGLDAAIGDTEWVFHAASQDLAGLRDVGLDPHRLFDTELASRLLGYPRVGLAAIVAEKLGLGLAKEHSAADWSTRPLPDTWLTYAALDVEVLLELRQILHDELVETGKQAWADQEFAAVLGAPPPRPKPDPWRRTSGIHAIRDRRQLGIVRELWQARDEIAQTRDVAPGRILPDAAIVQAAVSQPTTRSDLLEMRAFQHAARRRYVDTWLAAMRRALALPASELPQGRRRDTDPVPPQRVWAAKFPDAAARLKRARVALAELAERHDVPAENLVPAAALRQICFEPPSPIEVATVAATLRDAGARPWQADLVAPALAPALVAEPGDAASD